MVDSESHISEGTIKDIEPYQARYRWVMLALISLLYSIFGMVVRAIAPLVTPIIEDLNISYSQMGIILGAWPLTYIIVATIGGVIIDKWGIRKSIFAGMITIGLSASLRYFADSFTTFLLCVALFGIGGPTLSIGAPKTIATWFNEKERGIAVGIYMTGITTGGLLALSLTNSLVMPLTGDSWRLTFVVYGLLAFIAAVVWLLLAKDIKSTETAESFSIAKVFTGLISVRNIQLILIMGFLSFAIFHGFSNWLPNILETGGLTPSVAGFAASIPVLVSIPCVIIIPRIVPPHLRRRIVALGYLVLAISIWIVMTTKGACLIAGLVLVGATEVFGLPLLILLLMDIPEVSARYMGSVGGMFFCIAEIGGFVGPLIVGAIIDLTGSLLVGATFFSGLAVIISAIVLLLKTKPSNEITA